uniref:Uncharacterized protein n=1 Tax=Meloidogyne enterolobii TaxID=390850 RepID=A0A6V7TRG9_MELEN|nr:unnamed protein product [Meloidogyne enterolobii]
MLEFEKLFENLASNGTVNAIKLNRKKFESIKLNLLKMGGEKAYDKLEEHFKQFLAQLHFERLEKILGKSFKEFVNSIKSNEKEEIDEIILEIKKKIRNVLGDLFFTKFELKDPFLFRLGIY